MLVSGVQQSDSVIYIHISILFQILFPFRFTMTVISPLLFGESWQSIEFTEHAVAINKQPVSSLLTKHNCGGSPWREWIISGPSCGEVIGARNWEQTNMGQSLVPSLTLWVILLDSLTLRLLLSHLWNGITAVLMLQFVVVSGRLRMVSA